MIAARRGGALRSWGLRGGILIALLGAGYVAAFVAIQPHIGDGVMALSVIPILVAAWLWGIRGGVGTAVGMVAINIALMQTLGGQHGFRLTQIPNALVAVAVGALCGWVRDLYLAQRHGARALEGIVAARTAELVAANRSLSAEVVARSAAEANLRGMIEGSRDAIWVVRDGQIAFANHQLAALVGATDAAALIGRDALSLLDPRDHDAFAASATGPPVCTVPREVHVVGGEGTRVLEVGMFSIALDGAPAMMAIGRDVTARKELEARAAAADRMAVLGTLTAGIGHEINNPLSVIVGNLEFIASALGERDADLDEALRDARQAAIRAGEIVRHMRIFLQSGASEAPADVRGVVEATVKMVANELRHRARVELELEAAPPVAVAEAQLGQVVLNLLVNASQALPEGRASDNRIAVRVRPLDGGERVRLEIADTGTGIPDDVRHRIFEPFFTTKPMGLGTGLGLWVCHQIVTSAGGTIDVESAPGHGTTFRIEFPALAGWRRDAAPARTRAAPRRATVLVVDDDPLVARSIARILRGVHELEVRYDAAEALALIGGGRRFDVILCDLMMPLMSGMEFFTRLSEQAPDQAGRVIFMTGGAFTPEATSFIADVTRPTLEKPFAHDAVQLAIEQVLDRIPAIAHDTACSGS